MFGGVKRVSNRISLMTENYVASWKNNNGGFESKETVGGGLYGLRLNWPRTNLDIGGFYFYDAFASDRERNSNFISSYFIPAYFSFTFKFGGRRAIGKIY